KKVLAAVLASSLLMMTACSTAEETTVTTTEETTVATTEETSEEPEETFSPGQYLGYEPLGEVVSGDRELIAHDFDLGSNASLELWEDTENGISYPTAPNYPEGEDVVITFKSDVELNAVSVAKYNPDNVDPMLAEHAAALAGSSDYPEFINLSNEASLTCEDDTYTFSIPGEFIEDGYTYQIGIGTREETDSNVSISWNIQMYIRCNVQ
ncbi:MAG: hypothetical protein J6Z43_00535, partial [Clostridiales bacterium]|nr:hypothetical protein [Clostridiales bacterium]